MFEPSLISVTPNSPLGASIVFVTTLDSINIFSLQYLKSLIVDSIRVFPEYISLSIEDPFT